MNLLSVFLNFATMGSDTAEGMLVCNRIKKPSNEYTRYCMMQTRANKGMIISLRHISLMITNISAFFASLLRARCAPRIIIERAKVSCPINCKGTVTTVGMVLCNPEYTIIKDAIMLSVGGVKIDFSFNLSFSFLKITKLATDHISILNPSK